MSKKLSKKKSQIKIITAEYLKHECRACDKGQKWFEKNFPDGVKVTKKGITELTKKLLSRKKSSLFNQFISTVYPDTIASLEFLNLTVIGFWELCINLDHSVDSAETIAKLFIKYLRK